MKLQKTSLNRVGRMSLATLLGTLLVLGVMTGLVLAGEDDAGSLTVSEIVDPAGPATQNEEGYWLILDSAKPVEDVLPSLLAILTELKETGRIADFKPEPVAGGPAAVPGLYVVAAADAVDMLRRLPGVLAATTELPPPPPAPGAVGALSASGVITGRITAAAGQPLAGDVEIYDGVSFAFIGSAATNANGVYAAPVTAPYNQAKVLASAPGYIAEWYADKPYFSEATVVPLSGGTETGKNVALSRGGTIAGSVAFEGGEPAENIFVEVWEADESNFFFPVGGGSTDQAGRFVVSGLKSDAYKVRFSGGEMLGDEWYQDQTGFENATVIDVTAGMTGSITAQVPKGGTITGTLTDGAGMGPATNVDVYVIASSNQVVADRVLSDPATGQYEVDGLAPGSYKVVFAADPVAPGTAYETQYYDDKDSLAGATTINVAGGAVVANINATLVQTDNTGLITGTLTKNGGMPLVSGQFVDIDIHNPDIEVILSDILFNSDGMTTQYTVANVKPGQYKVGFDAFFGAGLNDEFYNDQADHTAADLVTVNAGAATRNINADLTTSSNLGGMTGTLTNGGGNPVGGADIWVQVYQVGESRFFEATSSVSGNGDYRIDDLPPGAYLVSFSQFPSATTWYNGQTWRGQAVQVVVTAGQTTPDIDGVLDELGACISGKILDVNGQGVENADFQVYDAEDNLIYFWRGLSGVEFTRFGVADEDGGYVACGLAAGTYTIKVADDLTGESEPTTVAPGEDKSGVDVTGSRPIYLPVVRKAAVKK